LKKTYDVPEAAEARLVHAELVMQREPLHSHSPLGVK
jgi:hypothetical protein